MKNFQPNHTWGHRTDHSYGLKPELRKRFRLFRAWANGPDAWIQASRYRTDTSDKLEHFVLASSLSLVKGFFVRD